MGNRVLIIAKMQRRPRTPHTGQFSVFTLGLKDARIGFLSRLAQDIVLRSLFSSLGDHFLDGGGRNMAGNFASGVTAHPVGNQKKLVPSTCGVGILVRSPHSSLVGLVTVR